MAWRRVSMWAGVVGPVLFAVGVVVGGRLQAGYSPVADAISELGASGAQAFWIQNANFLVYGAAVVLFSPSVRGLRRGGVVFALLLLVGVATAGSGFAHCSPGCPFPGEDPGATFADVVHNVLGGLVFVPGIVAPLVAASGPRGDHAPSGYRLYSRLSGWFTAVAFVVFVPSDGIGLEGLFERLMLAAPFAWIAVTAVLLLRGRLPAPEPAPRAPGGRSPVPASPRA